nr:hypothetical protein [Tanacetum cinerariifolium]
MQHPVDGKTWKDFDTKYLDFAAEPRNIRLGLVADGFNPFGNVSVETIDVATGLKFNMRAVVLWTINDFLARSKTAYVGHKRFLKKPHKWRMSLEFNGETKNGDPPRKSRRDAIMTQLARLPTRVKGKHP